MSQKILELEDRSILDTGEVVMTINALVELARDGQEFHSYLAENSQEVQKYNKFSKTPLRTFSPGIAEKPKASTYEWNTPSPYDDLDIWETCANALIKFGKQDDEVYIERLQYELTTMEERKMFPLLRHLVFLTNHFRKNKIVWGVGRGSSCASLVLYLLDVNKIDPIKYDIPIEEFLR